MPPSVADTIKSKTILRQVAINKISELLEFAQRGLHDVQYENLFMAAFDDISDIKDSFYTPHNIIIELDTTDDAFSSHDNIRKEFDLKVTRCRVHHQNFIAQSRSEAQPAQPSSTQRIPLPPLQLKRFGGDILEFTNFIELYKQIVHNNTSLSDIEKFNYLLSVLTGPALQLVKSLPISAANYSIAFQTLVDRYSNLRVMASTLWAGVLDAPRVVSDHPVDLRSLIDTFREALDALHNIQMPVDLLDFILGQTLYRKLDPNIISAFELHYNSNEIPTYEALFKFLESRCVALENVKASQPSKSGKLRGSSRNTSLVVHTNPLRCSFCTANHALHKCDQFLSKSVSERFNHVKSCYLCINCLRTGHRSNQCTSKHSCRWCNNKHHTLLHFGQQFDPSGANDLSLSTTSVPRAGPEAENAQQESLPISPIAMNISTTKTNILLATARVAVLDSTNKYLYFRALIDSGSMQSLVTTRCLSRLGLRATETAMQLHGLGCSILDSTKGITLTIRPLNCGSPVLLVDTVVVPRICDNLPHCHLPPLATPALSNIDLADPHFNIPGPVDILLGADIFSSICLPKQLKLGELTMFNTVFGFILLGRYPPPQISPVATSLVCLSDQPSLETLFKRMWEVDGVPACESKYTVDEARCEQIFLESTTRDITGRFVVQLPFRDGLPEFPGSRDLAMRRLFSLESRLSKLPELYDQYRAFMTEYHDLGHMSEVEPSSVNKSFYLPHHCVLKPESTSTKIRVVFNASAQVRGTRSLNESLLTGPRLQQDIVTLLLNFRIHRYVITSDIRMMYRQILVDKNHREYQRILWRSRSDEPVKDYTLNTVTYGTSAAPFLALRVIRQLALDHLDSHPLAAQALLNSTYVDDIIHSSPTSESARRLKSELIFVLSSAGFELRKWASNDPSILSDLDPEYLAHSSIKLDLEDVTLKVLGLQWQPSQDSFHFNVTALPSKCTKRIILSSLARIFDPLGFISPVTLSLKQLLQALWSMRLDWDDPPPSHIETTWHNLGQIFQTLNQVNIPRLLVPFSYERLELHCFGDSSEQGYCAVTYLRCVTKDGISISFVWAKSKVAPLRKLSLPRLELCAAVLVAKLASSILSSFASNISSIHCWTDSMIVLGWIRGGSHLWKTFVANRVAYILGKTTVVDWHYVPSGKNPADVGSRGLRPVDIVHCSLWWDGPEFLKHEISSFEPPESSFDKIEETELEQRHATVVVGTSHVPNILDTLLDKFSSLTKIQRILAYIRRVFIGTPKSPFLSGTEVYDALLLLVKRQQAIHFHVELDCLFNSKRLPKSFAKLAPFVDDKGLLRVGGRLRHANLPFSAKHPVLLPAKSNLTELLVRQTHERYFHAGIQTLQSLISQQFWIVPFKRVIRRVVSKCLRCWKTNPRPAAPPLMGDLPSYRLSAIKPFSAAGVDFAGPIRILLSRYRGAKVAKAYICVFICCSIKAVHLELVSDLSSDAFIAALKRFIGRRGRCTQLYSDRGTNFVGASKKLQESLTSAAQAENICWNFIPPSAPHMGGLWESSVKNVKSYLIRVVGDQLLTYEEFNTVLVQVEAIVNSRPISPMSQDPNDLTALTPGHFLTLDSLGAPPEPFCADTPPSRLSRWALLCKLHQSFWARWSRDYLHNLQQRCKWFKDGPSVESNSMVLIKNDLLPPLKWQLGRIVDVHPGEDGRIRVATVRTSHGLLKRPIVKLCPLPNYFEYLIQA